MSLGERVRATRERLGMTQGELATALGVTPQHVSAIEQDKRAPSLSFLTRLAEWLGVSIDYLVTGKEGVNPDMITAIRAEESLPIKVRKALVTLVEALRESTPE